MSAAAELLGDFGDIDCLARAQGHADSAGLHFPKQNADFRTAHAAYIIDDAFRVRIGRAEAAKSSAVICAQTTRPSGDL